MKCYGNKEEKVINFAGDGRNEQSSGKWGERGVTMGISGEVTSDQKNEWECDNLGEG